MDFEDGHHSGHLGFPISIILAIFYLQVTPMLPTKFGINWPFRSGEEGYHGFPIGTILAIFDLQVTPMLPNKFRVNWLLSLGEEMKNRFSRHLGFSITTVLAIFDLQVTRCFLPSLESTGLLVWEKK